MGHLVLKLEGVLPTQAPLRGPLEIRAILQPDLTAGSNLFAGARHGNLVRGSCPNA